MGTICITQNYRDYYIWCRKHGVNPDRRDIIAADDPNALDKLSGVHIASTDFIIIGDPKMNYSFWQKIRSSNSSWLDGRGEPTYQNGA